MLYVSTRGDPVRKSFWDILLKGTAPDGGLYLPEWYPTVTPRMLGAWRHLPFHELAFQILSLFIDDIPAEDLRSICRETFSSDNFGNPAITPVRPLGNTQIYIQGLSGGPTCSFKDLALQLLGRLFEYELKRSGQHLNILGATSGDTGSAAAYAMRGREGVRLFMLSPKDRMSPFQQAQMYSLQDPDIHNIVIDGVFDECQAMVKAVNGDPEFTSLYSIGAVNSINWARIMVQVVYYFYGYFQTTQDDDERVSFAVPSGNFGNACAGHVARLMGLPIHQLIVATNLNDVLDEFFRNGIYRVRRASDVFVTSSPSMDIAMASNFERVLADALNRKGARVAELFGQRLKEFGFFSPTDREMMRIAAELGFVSGVCTEEQCLETIKSTWRVHHRLVDPHTAVALHVAGHYLRPGIKTLVLETALPTKFSDTIRKAIGTDDMDVEAELRPPPALEGIEGLPRRYVEMGTDVDALKAYIAQVCA